MNARDLLQQTVTNWSNSVGYEEWKILIEDIAIFLTDQPEPAIRYNPVLVIDVFEEGCEHKFNLNWVSSPVNWGVGQYKLSTVPPKPETKLDPITWLSMYKPSGKDFEFAEPNEKATNPEYWTDAFPVYAEPPKRETKPDPVAYILKGQTMTGDIADYLSWTKLGMGVVAKLEGYEPTPLYSEPPKREPVLLKDTVIHFHMHNNNGNKVSDWLQFGRDVEQAVLKANGIGTDND
jgi:hypothetical protein